VDPVAQWVADPHAMARTEEDDYLRQHWWASRMTEARKMAIMSRGTLRDQVRLVSQEGPVASAWLGAISTFPTSTVLRDNEFRSLIRWVLGLSLLSEGVSLPECLECG
jgi:hypothetical protein